MCVSIFLLSHYLLAFWQKGQRNIAKCQLICRPVVFTPVWPRVLTVSFCPPSPDISKGYARHRHQPGERELLRMVRKQSQQLCPGCHSGHTGLCSAVIMCSVIIRKMQVPYTLNWICSLFSIRSLFMIITGLWVLDQRSSNTVGSWSVDRTDRREN